MKRRNGTDRRWTIRVTILVAAVVSVTTGCTPPVELRVPFALDQEPFIGDLERSGVRVPIVSGDSQFHVCDTREDRCVSIEFVDDRLESTVIDAVALFVGRTDLDRVVLVGDERRRHRLQSIEFRDIDTRSLSGSETSVVEIYRQEDESIDAFIQRTVDSVDMERDGIIAILGEHTPELVRRLGRAERAVGVVPELFLSGAIDRIREAGYPIIGSISPDIAKILAEDHEVPKDHVTTYVDLRLFRY